MPLSTQILIGSLTLILSVAFHAISFDRIAQRTDRIKQMAMRFFGRFWGAATLTIVVGFCFFILFIEMLAWSLLYLTLNIQDVPDLETALYFSISTFTTVGYGDVFLGKEWRVLSAIEAINGFLLFGWTTAFIFDIVLKVSRKEEQIKDKMDEIAEENSHEI